MHTRPLHALGTIALAAALVACGSSVTYVGGDGTGATGGVGGTTSTGGTTTGGTTGTGGTNTGTGGTTSTGGTGGTGGTVMCGQSHDGFGMQLTTYFGEQWGCDFGPATWEGELTMQAQVVDSFDNELILDSCPPNAFCEPEINHLMVHAPELHTYIQQGAFVELFVRVEFPWACTNQISIRNLPVWGGEPNPVMPGQRPWLIASDGVLEPPQGAPFGVERVGLDCYPGEPSCGFPKDDFVLLFRSPLDPSSTLELPMGETSEWMLNGPNGPIYWYLRNLRSYESGLCDDYWNWAWWMLPDMLDQGG